MKSHAHYRKLPRSLAKALAAATIASLALAGCTSEGTPTEGGDRTLTVWDFQYSSEAWGEALKQLDQNFEQANPGVTIEHVGQPFGEYDALLKGAFTSQTGPDVIMALPAAEGILSYTSSLVPLNDRITDEQRNTLSGWEPVSKDFDPTLETYGIPFGNQGIVFYYNKQLFAQAGLDPEAPPTTYDELVAAAVALKAAGITPFGGGNVEGYTNDWWFTILAPSIITAAQTFELANNDLKFTDDLVKVVEDRYVDLYNAGYFGSDYLSLPLFTDGVASFAAGNEAIFLGLPSSDASYVQFNAGLGEENVGVFQAPGEVAGEKANFLPYSAQVAWSITEFSTQSDLAYDYISYLTGAEGAQLQFDVGGVLPNNSQVVIGDSVPAQVKQILADQANAKQLSFPPHGLWAPQVSADHQKQLNLVLGGQISVEDALAALQATQDRSN